MQYLIPFYIFLAILSGSSAILNHESGMIGGGYRTQRGPLNAITLNSVATDLLPDGNNTRDIGAFGFAWKDLFVSGTAYISQLLIIDSATTTGHIKPAINNSFDLGAYNFAFKNIYVSSTSYLSSATTTMIEPWANNVSNLGSFSKAWKDIFTSGTLRVSGDIQLNEGQGLFFDEDLDTKIFANGDDVIRLFAGGGNKLTVGANSIEAVVMLTPNNNAAKDLGAYGKAWMNLFVSSTSFLGSVTSTMIEPSANDTFNLGSYGKAWGELFVSSSSHLSKCHVQVAASTTQAIATADTPQEVLFGEVEDEHCDWNVVDGVPTAAITIPRDGSYQMMYCFSPRLSSAPAGRTFEYALFEDGTEHPYSGAVRSINSINDLGRTCSMHHGEFTTGEELTIKFSGSNTNVELGATTTVFTGPMPSATFDIWEVDGL